MGFWNSRLRTRRKPHRCATCGQEVAAGEVSYDESGLYDGELSAYKQCRACHDIAAYFFRFGVFDHSEGYMLHELADVAREEGLLWPPVWNYVASAEEGQHG